MNVALAKHTIQLKMVFLNQDISKTNMRPVNLTVRKIKPTTAVLAHDQHFKKICSNHLKNRITQL
ncbi:hypothetical protein LVJ82_16150 [Vitreoscilla massiliensis]|uniref:Uncharacterized protein n=1 Tax=Vitreoscilla massiliensis TaxID=1689272 RepID=A0ABY4DZJ0_9NEIS|nr:hypothetical protein [Vitreoscilla massiliensis]UOO88958.1 hypothetical protein LVJ82_16150 [Vitreoscilla massiliensis]